jgi:hypothetical protein
MASGAIHKDRYLAVTGPYAHLRHPLYLGSFIVGLGLVLAGGRWLFLPLFLGIFLWMYGRAVRLEAVELETRYGEAYRRYRAQVPGFLPRFRPYDSGESGDMGGVARRTKAPGFQFWLFKRNREWGTTIGVAVGFALLWLKWAILG